MRAWKNPNASKLSQKEISDVNKELNSSIPHFWLILHVPYSEHMKKKSVEPSLKSTWMESVVFFKDNVLTMY